MEKNPFKKSLDEVLDHSVQTLRDEIDMAYLLKEGLARAEHEKDSNGEVLSTKIFNNDGKLIYFTDEQNMPVTLRDYFSKNTGN
jgi:hypothetical protein